MFSIYNQFNSREQKNKTNLEAINKLCGAIFEKKKYIIDGYRVQRPLF